MFGVDLTTVVKMEGGLIPNILTKCIEELQSRGMSKMHSVVTLCGMIPIVSSDLNVPGVYRVSGQSREVIELKEKFNDGKYGNL